MRGLMRHIEAVANIGLPGSYHPLQLGEVRIGYVLPAIAGRLWSSSCGPQHGRVELRDGAALARAANNLAENGFYKPRHELFDVRAEPNGAVLARLDRGALPVFGILAEGTHVNGLVRQSHGWSLWVAKRAADRPLDPGKLDHVTAGGIPSGMDAVGTLLKEAHEEASIPAGIARQARKVSEIRYAMARPEGLRRDRLHCFDLELPADFRPEPGDAEIERFTLMPMPDVLERLHDTDDFKFNVALVLIDLFARFGLIDPAGEEMDALRAVAEGLG